MNRTIFAIALLAACGGSGHPSTPSASGTEAPASDPRTPFERRREAACDAIEPVLVKCAVDDVRARLDAGAITKEQYAKDTAPELQRGLAQDWHQKCRSGYMSSRQVRVLEVCYREEKACEPLQACLANLNTEPRP